MKYSVVIVGGGPGGLACATKLAEKGFSTLLIERKKQIGPKVCAGGITWNGLIKLVPEELIEDAFPEQYIYTRLQKICVSNKSPIIATIDRVKFGQHMANQAIKQGVTILTDTSVRFIQNSSVEIYTAGSQKTETIHFDYLVGADGSLSKVRRYLQVPTTNQGIGINYQIPLRREKMEWHLNTKFFNNGYGWIFPHKNTLAIGAYVDQQRMVAKLLKENLIKWAHTRGIDLTQESCSAELINFDYRGWEFGNVFLVGDAAGLASALTGEGIYQAIISGETVAERISNPHSDTTRIDQMIKRQKMYRKMISITGKNSFYCSSLAELGLLLLRLKILNYRHLEMAS